MKKLILCITLALVTAGVQAGSSKVSNDSSSCCCSDTQVTKSTKSQSTTKQTKSTTKQFAKQTASKRSLASPKALADAR